MCAIAGALGSHQDAVVKEMIESLLHRGPDGNGVVGRDNASLGHARLAIIDPENGGQPMCDPESHSDIVVNGEIYNHRALRKHFPKSKFRTKSDTEILLALSASHHDPIEWLGELEGMFALAVAQPNGITIARDPLGIKPLYIGRQGNTPLFASEIKALTKVGCGRIFAFPPGYVFQTGRGMRRYSTIYDTAPEITEPNIAARGVLKRLVRSVRSSLVSDVPVGSFLSGGLDSSLIAAIARRFVTQLDTFAVGMDGSHDLERAAWVAERICTRHHERKFTFEEAFAALPDVIDYLESFDCALVRSAIPNFFLARLASKYVKVALSGEGADELFAGYSYLKELAPDQLQEELLQITRSLHNTNLQRCDRMSMAHGLEVRVPFLDDPELVDYAFRLHTDLKVRGPQKIEKWILRKAVAGLIPREIVLRKKEKFAAGAGLGEQFAVYAERTIPDSSFAKEREISDSVILRSKEELLYFRIFKQVFPVDSVIHLIGHSRSV